MASSAQSKPQYQPGRDILKMFMKVARCLCDAFVACLAALSISDRSSLDLGWKFHIGNSADPSNDFGYGTGSIYSKSGAGVGPIRPGFDDSTWRSVDIPHDWAVELPFAENVGDLIGHDLCR